jgi:hypothetical protein
MRRLAGRAPGNFLWVYSYGGRQDADLTPVGFQKSA